MVNVFQPFTKLIRIFDSMKEFHVVHEGDEFGGFVSWRDGFWAYISSPLFHALDRTCFVFGQTG